MEQHSQVIVSELIKISNVIANICIENSRNCIKMTQKENFNTIFKKYTTILEKRDSNLDFNIFEVIL